MKAASIQTPLVKSCSHLSIRHQEQCLVHAQETKYYLNSQWSNIILSHVSTASITETGAASKWKRFLFTTESALLCNLQQSLLLFD